MFSSLINIVKSASAFLQNGVAPPNTPESLKEKMENTNHLASKKFFMVLIALIVVAVFHYSSVLILLVLHDTNVITAFVTLTTKTFEVIAWMVSFWLTGQSVIDLKYSGSTDVKYSSDTKKLEEDVNKTEDKNITYNLPEKEDDYCLDEYES